MYHLLLVKLYWHAEHVRISRLKPDFSGALFFFNASVLTQINITLAKGKGFFFLDDSRRREVNIHVGLTLTGV